MSEPSTETAPQTERTVKQNPHSETLRAAFPGIDVTVINAVLVASSNNIEKAFDALLGMSDPDYRPEPLAHTVSPQPVLSDEQEQQIRMDELFARQLATQNRRVPRQRAPSTPPDEQERSFLDDDLPILKENIIQGFNETKVKVGSFINNLRAQYTQRVDGQVPPGNSRTGQQQPDSRSLTQYDHDALSLDDDFGELQLEDNTTPVATSPVDTKSRPHEIPVLSKAKSTAIGEPPKGQPLPETKKSPDEGLRQSFSLGEDEEED